ncbi:transcription factor [Pseudozyma hubeiensis SY62]|uniref:Transcription factor n=1 Tax=Pseudozyma hubeiensis (strain SY62) TaxID=1305764 RepID=R9NVL3_PSEHS|nr:transcription factor [Pseudozyma hubeiensis SY62]GAC92533.1 transcription factor [Pseudozyma hubeiensis SY62]
MRQFDRSVGVDISNRPSFPLRRSFVLLDLLVTSDRPGSTFHCVRPQVLGRSIIYVWQMSAASRYPRKRPLAKRSCLKCREAKARCELPDIYIDSSRTPLSAEKQCHRCRALDIDCIVWDGDRKRKPRLGGPNKNTPGSSQDLEACSAPESGDASQSYQAAEVARRNAQTQSTQEKSPLIFDCQLGDASGSSSSSYPKRTLEGEQLGLSDLRHAQQQLIGRQKGWKSTSKTLNTLMERLMHGNTYHDYLKLRIDAPPHTPDMVTFLPRERMQQLNVQLQDYLVEHPYLPSFLKLREEQAQSATAPRSLLLAAMTLLGLKGVHDELVSSEVRTLSNYVDRLGTQLLLSSPRDVHLVMAFELLLAHEPGLIGTAASQFEPESRGFGLASENLLTCATKIAKELKLDSDLTCSQHTPSSIARLSLWCCLRSWDGVFGFMGEKVAIPEDLDQGFAATVRQTLACVDDGGKELPLPPRLRDANASMATSFEEMRQFCAQSEERLGRDGILRSAGRTVLCMRIETVCCLFSSLRKLQSLLVDTSSSLREKRERIVETTTSAYDAIMQVRHNSHERMGFYAGQRIVRLWEQVSHIECAFFSAILGSYATSALFSGDLDGQIDSHKLVQVIRFGLVPAEQIGKLGRYSVDASLTLLATVSQMDHQPALRRQSRQSVRTMSRYLHRLPTLLVCAMTVHAARQCLENIAFVLVAWARAPTDADTSITLMEAATVQLRQLSLPSSVERAHTISQLSADYIDEMVETARLWQVYYRVYRPVSSIKLDQASESTEPDAGTAVQESACVNSDCDGIASSKQAPSFSRATPMDFLASAAEAATASRAAHGAENIVGTHVEAFANDASFASALATTTDLLAAPRHTRDRGIVWNDGPSSTATTSSHAGMIDAEIYNAQVPFDIEAFLKDVDQLF